MANQMDKDCYKQLQTQLAAKIGMGAADFSLEVDHEGGSLTLRYQGNVITAFDAPVRGGAILNACERYRARPTLESLPEQIAIGPYHFHARRSTLKHGDETIALTDKERDILVALWNAPQHALERDALLDAVWAYAEGVETHTLETHIYRLRRKIETDPGEPQWLVNSGGLYQLNT